MAKRNKNNARTLIALAVIICLAIYYFLFGGNTGKISDFPVDGADGVYVHFIDVGQGDSALIQGPNGNILIDAGTAQSADDLCRYIDSLQITEFAYAVFTHPHADHIGGATAVLERYNVLNIVMPDAVSTSATFEKMLDAIEEENCKVTEGKAGVSFSLGEITVKLLAPVGNYSDNLNNESVVAKVLYGDTSFLFTGDAEKESETDMLKNGEALCADVLKVGHHGSSTSSTADFLNAVSPKIAVISVAAENDYGHPHAATLSSLEAMNVKIYRTDKNGNIIVFSDGKTISVKTEK